ncbi:hypothetical protein [Rhodonellum sp.]|uniref:hypothetical protein n=1 Tax=Rhodonellum sp. TaxID=2231180 RepID=UPI00271CC9F5|nr:hypothetical protein [Rhodonellum sp.]MDO9551585.1 hypothetical protein [Rhodonellum sp.]
MKKSYTITFFTFFLVVFASFAQDTTPVEEPTTGSLNSGTISSQFDYLKSVSNNFQEYKVIKRTNLDKIEKNVLDSLKVFKDQLLAVNQQLAEKREKMLTIEAEMNANLEELKAAEEARDSFSFMGMAIHKSAYNSLMWTIVAGLAVALGFFLFKYSQSHKVITRAENNLNETVEEFEQHRKNTLERERKLKRELVDAMNGKKS